MRNSTQAEFSKIALKIDLKATWKATCKSTWISDLVFTPGFPTRISDLNRIDLRIDLKSDLRVDLKNRRAT